MQANIIPYRTVIKHVIHISDIHIHLFKRHQEYEKVFEELYKEIQAVKQKFKIAEDKNKNISVILIITGDILHSKSELSPECVNITYNFFKRLATIIPTFVIPGNHDVNMNNKTRLDSLTPIIADLRDNYPLYYLSETGVWIINNLVISHSSIFDYKIITRESLDEIISEHEFSKTAEKNLCHCVMYHGRINGVELYNGTTLRGEVDTTTNKTITMSAFEGYDICLFGDVHRHHFVENLPHAAYAGSLIQQNYGESIEGHGYILWDLKKKTGKFTEISNDSGYYSFYLKNGLFNDMMIDDDILSHSSIDNLASTKKRLNVRINYFKTNKSDVAEFISILKKKFELLSVTYQELSSITANDGTKEIVNVDDAEAKKYLNISNINYQNSMLKDILVNDLDLEDEETINAILDINEKSNKLFVSENENRTAGTNFKLLKLAFGNLFSYGENNVIDFQKCKGVVGLVAPNHTGKSSILDILLFMLFDKTSRKGKLKDIINNRRQNFEAVLELQLDGWKYIIKKSGSRTPKSAKCNTEFCRRHLVSGREQRLEKDNDTETKKYINDLFGNFEDSIYTTFSIQTDATGFIDSSNTMRRAELERILRMDFINLLSKEARSKHRDSKAVFEHLQKTMSPEKIIEIKENIASYESDLVEKCELNTKYIAECKEIQLAIDELNKQYDSSVEKKFAELTTDLDIDNLTDIDEEAINERYKVIDDEISSQNEKLELIDKKVAKYKSVLELDSIDSLDELKSVNKKEKIELNKKLGSVIQKINLTYKKISKIEFDSLEDIDSHSTKLNDEINSLDIKADLDAKLKEQQKKLDKYEKLSTKLKTDKAQQELPEKLGKLVSNYQQKLQEFNKFLSSDKASNRSMLIEKAKEIGFTEGLHNYSNVENSALDKKISDCEGKVNSYKEKIEQMENDISANNKLLLRKKEIENEIKNLEKIKEQFLTNEKISVEIEELEDECEKVKSELTLIDTKLESISKLENYLLKEKSILVSIKELEVKKKNINSMSKELDSLIKDMEANENNRQLVKTKLAILNETSKLQTDIVAEIDEMRDNISKLNGQMEEMKSNSVEKNEKEQLMITYDYYLKALKLLPLKLIRDIKLIFEQRVNDFLTVITNFTLKIEISDTSIEIYLVREEYNGNDIMITNCSGFERFISSLAIRLALLDITQLPVINMMAIDEGWSCFDNENISNLDIIFNHLVQRFDFILTISHLQEIKQHCDIQINLKRNEDEFSSINYS